MSNVRQSTFFCQTFPAQIGLAADGLLLGARCRSGDKVLHLRSEQHQNGAGSELRLRFVERWTVTLLGVFTLHTLHRLEDSH